LPPKRISRPAAPPVSTTRCLLVEPVRPFLPSLQVVWVQPTSHCPNPPEVSLAVCRSAFEQPNASILRKHRRVFGILRAVQGIELGLRLKAHHYAQAVLAAFRQAGLQAAQAIQVGPFVQQEPQGARRVSFFLLAYSAFEKLDCIVKSRMKCSNYFYSLLIGRTALVPIESAAPLVTNCNKNFELIKCSKRPVTIIENYRPSFIHARKAVNKQINTLLIREILNCKECANRATELILDGLQFFFFIANIFCVDLFQPNS